MSIDGSVSNPASIQPKMNAHTAEGGGALLLNSADRKKGIEIKNNRMKKSKWTEIIQYLLDYDFIIIRVLIRLSFSFSLPPPNLHLVYMSLQRFV